MQHFLADGSIAPSWPANGVQVCGAVGDARDPRLALGNGGFVYVAWNDTRYPGRYAYVACLDPSGAFAPGCPFEGRRLVEGEDSALLDMLADGQGGAFVLRWKAFPLPQEIRIHRVSTDVLPVPTWPLAGRALDGSPPFSSDHYLSPDGAGGTYAIRKVEGGPSSPPGLYAIHLAADGLVAPGWSSVGAILTTTDIGFPSAIVRSNEGAIAAWTDSRHPEGYTVYATRLGDDGPVAIDLSLVETDARPDGVTLRWRATSGTIQLATIWRRGASEDWTALGDALADGVGDLVFEDAAVIPGARYGYRVSFVDEGTERFAGEVWVTIPGTVAFTLEPAWPAPAPGPVKLSFSLDGAEEASLEIIDVSGRRVLVRELGAPGPGRHTLELSEASRLAPGVYLVRLAHGDRARVRRRLLMR